MLVKDLCFFDCDLVVKHLGDSLKMCYSIQGEEVLELSDFDQKGLIIDDLLLVFFSEFSYLRIQNLDFLID